jgi:hypothetical protein
MWKLIRASLNNIKLLNSLHVMVAFFANPGFSIDNRPSDQVSSDLNQKIEIAQTIAFFPASLGTNGIAYRRSLAVVARTKLCISPFPCKAPGPACGARMLLLSFRARLRWASAAFCTGIP